MVASFPSEGLLPLYQICNIWQNSKFKTGAQCGVARY